MDSKFIDMILPSIDSYEIKSKDIRDNYLDKLTSNIIDVKIPIQTIKESMQNTILSIVDVLDSQNLNDMSYDIDDVELGINIGIDGKVSLASIIGGELSTQTTLKIRLKKKK